MYKNVIKYVCEFSLKNHVHLDFALKEKKIPLTSLVELEWLNSYLLFDFVFFTKIAYLLLKIKTMYL